MCGTPVCFQTDLLCFGDGVVKVILYAVNSYILKLENIGIIQKIFLFETEEVLFVNSSTNIIMILLIQRKYFFPV